LPDDLINDRRTRLRSLLDIGDLALGDAFRSLGNVLRMVGVELFQI
jgi:hypothetical protein